MDGTQPAAARPSRRELRHTLQSLGPGPIPIASLPGCGPTPSAQSAWLGRRLGGRYELHAVLGQGTTATVYRAQHVRIEQSVAVKVLRPELSDDVEAVQRFLAEARVLARLRHPNLVRVHDFERSEGVAWLAMELLDGESLVDRLRRLGRLTWTSVRRLMLQLCGAIQAAHDAGIVHRDIKPDNCICCAGEAGEETLKIVDFGIAATRFGRQLRSIGPQNIIAGTPQYMAPEAIRGEADERSDIYSAGVMMYELLTGTLPRPCGAVVPGKAAETVERPSRRAPGCCTKVVDAVVLRAIRLDPAERFETMREFAEAIRRAHRAGPDKQVVDLRDHPSAAELGLDALGVSSMESLAAGARPDRSPRRGVRWSIGALAAAVVLGLGISPPSWPEAPRAFVSGVSRSDSLAKGWAERMAATRSVATQRAAQPVQLELSCPGDPAGPQCSMITGRRSPMITGQQSVDASIENRATERLLEAELDGSA